jgi:hypothetical protein
MSESIVVVVSGGTKAAAAVGECVVDGPSSTGESLDCGWVCGGLGWGVGSCDVSILMKKGNRRGQVGRWNSFLTLEHLFVFIDKRRAFSLVVATEEKG